jgi:hypothetical protein
MDKHMCGVCKSAAEAPDHVSSQQLVEEEKEEEDV